MFVPSSAPSRALLAAIAVMVLLPAPARPQEEAPEPRTLGPFELSGEIGIVSDYVDRGISASDNDPAVQAGLTLAMPVGEGEGALYFGGWASTVDFDEEGDGPVEVEIFTGIYGTFAETVIDWDVWASYYVYPGARGRLDYDYAELSGRLGRTFGEGLDLDAGYAFSPDYFGSSGLSHYVDVGTAYTLPLLLPLPITLDARLGRQWFESNSRTGLEDYLDWRLGVTTTWRALDIGLHYTDTDLDRRDCYGGTNLCDSRVVLSVTARF